MDYKLMWQTMKVIYEEQMSKLEKGSELWLDAKRIVDIMNLFEQKEAERGEINE